MATKKDAKAASKVEDPAAAVAGVTKEAKRKPVAKPAAAEAAGELAQAQDQTAKAVVDGVEYALASLSDEARQHMLNVRGVDQEIERLRQRLAITQTARSAYMAALKKALPTL